MGTITIESGSNKAIFNITSNEDGTQNCCINLEPAIAVGQESVNEDEAFVLGYTSLIGSAMGKQ